MTLPEEKGKSHLAKVLRNVYGFDMFDDVTSAHDTARFIYVEPKGSVIDVTRGNEKCFSYNTLDILKNGFVMSGKYEGIRREFAVVPLVVFANFEPDKDRLSVDHWEALKIDNALLEETAQETLPTLYAPPPTFPSFEEKKAGSDVSSETVGDAST